MISVRTLLAAVILHASGLNAQPIDHNVAYGPDSLQRLDIGTPIARGYPTIIFVHGGSLTSGDKNDDDYRNVCATFPANGIACASINYRLAPRHAWPAQAEDVAAALKWVRTNIAEKGGDPNNVFLMGHSSGAALVATVSTDERFLAAHNMKLDVIRGVISMGSIMYDDDLEQAIARYGRDRVDSAFKRDSDNRMFGSLEAYQAKWPVRHIHSGLPPFLFLIAEKEQHQPPILKTNQKFVDAARRLGNCAKLVVLPGRNHYSAIHRIHIPGDSVFRIVEDFVKHPRGFC